MAGMMTEGLVDYGLWTLEDMYVLQREFQELVGDVDLPESRRVDRIARLALLQQGQTTDMMKALGHETHRPFVKPLWDNALIEWVDQLKYLLAEACVAGWTPQEIGLAFAQKSALVQERFIAERDVDRSLPVAVFDLDGVICHYERLMEPEEFARGVLAHSAPIHNSIGFLTTVRSWGMRVVIVTSRKVYRYRRMELETTEWLRRNHVPYDQLVFAYDKSEAVAGLNVQFVVEDSAKHALDYADAGHHVFLVRSNDPDSGLVEHELIEAVGDVGHMPVAVADYMRRKIEAEAGLNVGVQG